MKLFMLNSHQREAGKLESRMIAEKRSKVDKTGNYILPSYILPISYFGKHDTIEGNYVTRFWNVYASLLLAPTTFRASVDDPVVMAWGALAAPDQQRNNLCQGHLFGDSGPHTLKKHAL